jgi:Tol biopolymer transport system component
MYTVRLVSAVAALMVSGLPAVAQQPPAPAVQTRVAIDPAQFDKFAGFYQLGPRTAVRIYREESRFYFSPVGTQQTRELVAETAVRFAVANVPVTISFRPGADGAVTEAIINQAGREIVAPRITEQAATALLAAANTPPPSVPRNWAVDITPHRVLTSSPGTSVDYWATFSPDGGSVLFSRSPDSGKSWALHRIPVAGGTSQVLFDRAGLPATRASVAPGGRIAFNAGNAIWTMNGDGSEARAVPLRDVIGAGYASWYPDGRSVAFVEGGRNILYRADVVSGAVTALTRQSEVLAGMPSLSRDGRWIVFAGQKNSGQIYNQGDNQIWLVDEAGISRPLEATPGPGRTPSWSPDGRRIAFESGRGSADGRYALFIINRDGSGLTQVTDHALNANHPAWSPDGKQLVFSWGSEPGKPNGIAVMALPK